MGDQGQSAEVLVGGARLGFCCQEGGMDGPACACVSGKNGTAHPYGAELCCSSASHVGKHMSPLPVPPTPCCAVRAELAEAPGAHEANLAAACTHSCDQ